MTCVKHEEIDVASSDRLEVMMFSSEYPPCWGGVGRHVQDLCRRVCEHVELKLVTATFGRPTGLFEIDNIAKIHVRSFPLLLTQYMVGVRLKRPSRTQLIHVHVPHAFIPRMDRRILSTFHVVWAQYADALKHQPAISLFDLQHPTINRHLIAVERKLAELSNAIIAVSQSVKDELVARYGLAKEKIHVIPNGVNPEIFCPAESRENLILYVGRQTAHKGLPYLLRAFAEFSKSHEQYRLMLIGERLEGGVDRSLVRLSEALGFRNKVEFTGRLPEDEVRKIMGQANCLVLPSLAESFGMTVLEAMASETPVVATGIGGIREIVRDGLNGLLVPPADSKALATSLERIVSDMKLRRRLVEEGKKTCKDFSWDKVAERTLALYRQVCS